MKSPTPSLLLLASLLLLTRGSSTASPTADYRFVPIEHLDPVHLILLAKPAPASRETRPAVPRFEALRPRAISENSTQSRPRTDSAADIFRFDTSLFAGGPALRPSLLPAAQPTVLAPR